MKFNNRGIILISLTLVFLAFYAALLACTLDLMLKREGGGNIPVVLEPNRLTLL